MNIGKNKDSYVFGCFTPPVMILTFLIEVGLALYVAVRHRWDLATKLVIALLALLSIFQLAEFSICEHLGLSSENWSKIGFASIALLPPLGMHLFNTLAGRPRHITTYAAYLTGAVWIAVFLSQDIFKSFGCGGNYIIFSLEEGWGGLFGAYYYFWLFTAVGLAVNYWAALKNKYQKSSLAWGVLGYLTFIIPTATITIIDPDTADGIPSIMCGFAVLFAIILVFAVLPNYHKSRKK